MNQAYKQSTSVSDNDIDSIIDILAYKININDLDYNKRDKLINFLNNSYNSFNDKIKRKFNNDKTSLCTIYSKIQNLHLRSDINSKIQNDKTTLCGKGNNPGGQGNYANRGKSGKKNRGGWGG